MSRASSPTVTRSSIWNGNGPDEFSTSIAVAATSMSPLGSSGLALPSGRRSTTPVTAMQNSLRRSCAPEAARISSRMTTWATPLASRRSTNATPPWSRRRPTQPARTHDWPASVARRVPAPWVRITGLFLLGDDARARTGTTGRSYGPWTGEVELVYEASAAGPRRRGSDRVHRRRQPEAGRCLLVSGHLDPAGGRAGRGGVPRHGHQERAGPDRRRAGDPAALRREPGLQGHRLRRPGDHHTGGLGRLRTHPGGRLDLGDLRQRGHPG